MKKSRAVVIAVTALLATATAVGPAMGEDADELRKPFVSVKSPPQAPSAYECDATGSPSGNVNLDCDDPYPNNEPHVAVDPENPLHVVASSNDYGSCCDEYYTTFDGGRTWKTGNMSHEGPNYIGSDPITVFDVKHDVVVHLSLNYKLSNSAPATNGDVVASVSHDGGLTWAVPAVIDHGRGARAFNDKEDATVDNNPDSPNYGRIYVTWTLFDGAMGHYKSAPIMLSWSDDGATTWSRPREISGFNPTYCTYQETGPAGECDENQFSSPRVAPDGDLYVAFENEQHEAAWESPEEFDDQYLIVHSTDGGRTFSDPVHVVDLEDGAADYPTNPDERATLTGYEFRVNSAGALAIAPSGRLYLTFSDNRSGTHDSGTTPVTQIESYIMASDDGVSWGAPSIINANDEQSWFPWVDVAPDGTVGVVYNETRAEGQYAVELAQGSPGSFSTDTVTTVNSHPNESLYFRAGIESCPDCTVFIGDYLGLDYGSDGSANVAWTDMRDYDATAGGYRQFIYFAKRPGL